MTDQDTPAIDADTEQFNGTAAKLRARLSAGVISKLFALRAIPTQKIGRRRAIRNAAMKDLARCAAKAHTDNPSVNSTDS
jgi:hypothetical protein